MKKALAFVLALFAAEAAPAQEASRPQSASTFGRVNVEGDDSAVARWIWHNLVPRQGQAETLQGELLRAVERLRWEAQTNGNVNWDDGFLRFLDFLGMHLATEPEFPDERKRAVQADLERLRAFTGAGQETEAGFRAGLPYVDDDLYDRLADAVVAFARLHPVLIPHVHDPAQPR